MAKLSAIGVSLATPEQEDVHVAQAGLAALGWEFVQNGLDQLRQVLVGNAALPLWGAALKASGVVLSLVRLRMSISPAGFWNTISKASDCV